MVTVARCGRSELQERQVLHVAVRTVERHEREVTVVERNDLVVVHPQWHRLPDDRAGDVLRKRSYDALDMLDARAHGSDGRGVGLDSVGRGLTILENALLNVFVAEHDPGRPNRVETVTDRGHFAQGADGDGGAELVVVNGTILHRTIAHGVRDGSSEAGNVRYERVLDVVGGQTVRDLRGGCRGACVRRRATDGSHSGDGKGCSECYKPLTGAVLLVHGVPFVGISRVRWGGCRTGLLMSFHLVGEMLQLDAVCRQVGCIIPQNS